MVWAEGVGDEISIIGKTKITELKDKKIRTFSLRPRDFGLKEGKLSQIGAKTVKDNVEAMLSVLKAEPSAKLDVVAANASCCFVLTGAAKDRT